MANVVVCKDGSGKLVGFGEKGGRAWARFQKMINGLGVGETLQFQWWEPRAPGRHKLFFARLNALFDRQEQFDCADKLRAWLTVGAGECDFMPGPKGRMVALPRSIAWHRLDETEFAELVRRIDDFLWSNHARAFLWPHLTTQQTYDIVEGLRSEFS